MFDSTSMEPAHVLVALQPHFTEMKPFLWSRNSTDCDRACVLYPGFCCCLAFNFELISDLISLSFWLPHTHTQSGYLALIRWYHGYHMWISWAKSSCVKGVLLKISCTCCLHKPASSCFVCSLLRCWTLRKACANRLNYKTDMCRIYLPLEV